MFLGMAAFEVLVVFWQSLIFREDVHAWGLIVIAAYIISHQTILWTMPALGSLRVLVLGIVGIVFIMAFGLPTFPQEVLPWWLRETFLASWLLVIAIGGFIASWIYVARQRSGGGSGRHWTNPSLTDYWRCPPLRLFLQRRQQFWSEGGVPDSRRRWWATLIASSVPFPVYAE
jgi:hypothetical protein